jgi:hypothetical protein
VPQSEIDRLIGEGTSAAVKDALKSLLEAPAPVTGKGRGSRSSARGPSRRSSPGSRAANGDSSRSPGGTSTAAPDGATLDVVRQAIGAGNGGASKSDVLAATGLSDAQWNAAINALLADGVVTKTGAARGTRYHLSTAD